MASSLVVYPNPVASMLHFQLANIGMKYTVRFYDVSGRLIDQTTVDEQHTTYELNHQLFSKGSYKAVFSTENSSEKFSTSF
ncbi:MAG: T9SS type A sorting domain-containing protein [Crocinitomicaceae bacterium]